MKARGLICCVLGFAVLLTGCAGGSRKPASMSATLYEPEFASGFEILGDSSAASVIIRSISPWQGADSVVTELFVQRNNEAVPPGFNGQVLKGDARRIVTMSSTHIAMLDAIGKTNRIVGVSGLDFVSNPAIRAGRDTIGDIGYDGNINYELLISLRPDIVLLYGINGASRLEGKLREFGIPFMYIGDYVEESPLGKAEWMVVLAEITGNRTDGENSIRRIAQSYDSLRTFVASAVTDRPEVFVNTPYADQWFMPSDKSYFIRLVNDAGGDYIYKKNQGTSSVPIGMEEAFLLASKADVWLNTGQARSLSDLQRDCPRFMNVGSVEQGNVYNNNLRSTPQGGNDAYESGTIYPDLMLRDMVKILHPELLPDSIPFVYYQQLK
ncbi:MAG: ABC transporter substrate-binding protein [Muribaculum sp.]|nr:ABC transporter substrate-binding protein [Muribaculaceae bacterium]MCM1081452.1 ABC transporter substrate-binding protein [Muribaculum sp.]